MPFPKSLSNKLEQRKQNNALRSLPVVANLIDFSSNDYLGFSKSEVVFDQTHQFLVDNHLKKKRGNRFSVNFRKSYPISKNRRFYYAISSK